MKTFKDLKVGDNLFSVEKDYSNQEVKYYLQSRKIHSISEHENGLEFNPSSGYKGRGMLIVTEGELGNTKSESKEYFSDELAAKKGLAAVIVFDINKIESDIEAKKQQIEKVRKSNYSILQFASEPEIG